MDEQIYIVMFFVALNLTLLVTQALDLFRSARTQIVGFLFTVLTGMQASGMFELISTLDGAATVAMGISVTTIVLRQMTDGPPKVGPTL